MKPDKRSPLMSPAQAARVAGQVGRWCKALLMNDRPNMDLARRALKRDQVILKLDLDGNGPSQGASPA
jgi:hypothetical protein